MDFPTNCRWKPSCVAQFQQVTPAPTPPCTPLQSHTHHLKTGSPLPYNSTPISKCIPQQITSEIKLCSLVFGGLPQPPLTLVPHSNPAPHHLKTGSPSPNTFNPTPKWPPWKLLTKTEPCLVFWLFFVVYYILYYIILFFAYAMLCLPAHSVKPSVLSFNWFIDLVCSK